MSIIHVFGIRHHGPGCARSLRTALETLEPDIVLVEGPPDAQAVLPLLAHEQMHPPVALLIYAPEQTRHAVYYPFNTFSPEWQALHYALTRDIPARFIDLPQAIQLARHLATEGTTTPAKPASRMVSHEAQTLTPPEQSPADAPPAVTPEDDPLALLAQAAGYTDHELWWEQQIEQRSDTTDLFAGILEAMTELRADTTPKNEEEALREAHMRQCIRAAQKEGFQRIAVVCGAWHAPVLVNPGPAKADSALLSGLKKCKVESTWIPWTNSRLAYRSGYGAGVTSPGWYEHLWTVPGRTTIHWIARAAQLLREEGLDASSASVIEAVRLSEALAAMRDLPMPGLAEHHEAIETVLCNGNATPMNLIRTKLEIGERMGSVPDETPQVPLQRDLEALQRKLRLKPSAEITRLELDLRNETDRARSQLLHRLNILSITWGKLQRVHGKSGTFHEHWQMQWQVEFAVALIEANIWGNTIELAAAATISHDAATLQDLPRLTQLLDQAILAELPEAVQQLLQAIQRCAAVSADVQHLMNALPPLARVARYGNVRQTSTERILPVIDALFERIVIGLPGACASLDDDAAGLMVKSINQAQDSIALLNRDDQRATWLSTLRSLLEREQIHGLVRGRCCRLLLEQNALDEGELERLTRLTLSHATHPSQAAAWVEGVLAGSGLLVLHQDTLWQALNGWLIDLPGELFESLLPILRRAFSGFQPAERRQMGEKVKKLSQHPDGVSRPKSSSAAAGPERPINTTRAERVLPILAQIMGGIQHANR